MKISIFSLVFLFFVGEYAPTHDELPNNVNRAVKKIFGKSYEADLVIDLVEFKTDIFSITKDGIEEGWVVLRRTKGCREGGCDGDVCATPESSYFDQDGLYEEFDYFFILDTDKNVVKVGVYDYPGDYGYEITSPWWLKQFIGYKGRTLKYGTDVDVVSGATVSATSLTQDIEAAYHLALTVIGS